MTSLRVAEWNKSHHFMLWLIRCLSYFLLERMLSPPERRKQNFSHVARKLSYPAVLQTHCDWWRFGRSLCPPFSFPLSQGIPVGFWWALPVVFPLVPFRLGKLMLEMDSFQEFDAAFKRRALSLRRTRIHPTNPSVPDTLFSLLPGFMAANQETRAHTHD